MTMFAVLAEDRSDTDALAVLIKRITGKTNAKILRKGFSGCGELCRKAWSHFLDFADQGATHFIICHDSDSPDPDPARSKINDALNAKIKLTDYRYKIVVPVQELEAWIIADEVAINKVIPTLFIKPQPQPETRANPKEWLIRESQRGRSRPLYFPTVMNARVAEFLDLDKVRGKCNSFNEFYDFITRSSEK